MNKAPLFSFGKGGLTLFGKSLSFSSALAGVVLAAIVVVGGVSLSSANPFSPDFAWSERSYEAQQAYDSSSYEVQEQNESDDQLHDNEDLQDETQDPSGDSYSRSNGTVSSFTPSEDPGSNSDTVGIGTGNGNSWFNGIQIDEHGFPLPGYEEVEAGGSNNVVTYGDPVASGSVEVKTRDTLQTLDISGRPKVLNASRITLKDLLPYLEVEATKRNADTGLVSSFDIDKSTLSLGTIAGGTATPATSYTVSAEPNFTYTVPVYYNKEGLNKGAYVICDVYSTYVTFDGDGNDPDYIRFSDRDTKQGFYQIPLSKWQEALAQADPGQLFLGWSLAKGGTAVGKGFTVTEGRPANLYNLGYVEPEGISFIVVENKDAASNQISGIDQALTGITDESKAVKDGTFSIPEGITAVDLSSMRDAPLGSVTKLVVSSTVSSINIQSVLKAFPNLESFEVVSDNDWFEAQDNGLLLVEKGDLNAGSLAEDKLISVLPKRDAGSTVSSPTYYFAEDIVSIDEHAFDVIGALIDQGEIDSLYIVPEGSNMKLDGQAIKNLPEITIFNIGDQATSKLKDSELVYRHLYCSLLSKCQLNNPSISVRLNTKLGATTGLSGGSFQVDKGIVVYVIDDASQVGGKTCILCYVPDTGESSFVVPNDVTILGQRAFQDAASVKTVQIPSNVTGFYDDPFYDSALDTLIIESPDTLEPLTFEKADPEETDPEEEKPTPCLLYLDPTTKQPSASLLLAANGVVFEDSKARDKWIADTIATFNMNEAFKNVTSVIEGALSGIVLDPSTGAIYLTNESIAGAAPSYTLYSVPASVESFTFLENTTAIASNAFSGCDSLILIEVPESVVSVGKDAFAKCKNLEVVYFEGDLISTKTSSRALTMQAEDAIGEGTDAEAEAGKSVTREEWLTEIGAFPDRTKNSLKHVGDRPTTNRQEDTQGAAIAFYSKDGSKLEALLSTFEGEFSLSPTTTQVANYACYGCTELTSIKAIPGVNAEVSLGSSSFEGCTSLTQIPDTSLISSLGDRAFANCGLEGEFALPVTIALGNEVFAENGSLTKVVLAGNYATLGKGTFKDCAGIEGVVVETGSTIAATGDETFAGCNKMLSLEIKGSINEIGKGAFKDCSRLGKVTFASSTQAAALKTISADAFRNSPEVTLPLSQLVNLSSIGDYAFYGNTALVQIRIPAALSSLGSYAFGKTNISELNFASGSRLAQIGAGAFYSCPRLNDIDLSNYGQNAAASQISIGANAFYGSTAFTKIEIPSRVTTIEKQAFQGCSELNTVLFGDLREDGTRASSQLTAVGESSFANCARLQMMDFSNTQLKAISNKAFSGCTSLSSVLLPSTILSIGDQAFTACPNIFNLAIYASAPPYVSSTAFDASNLSKLVVNVPASQNNAVLNNYRQSPSWVALFAQDKIASTNSNVVTGAENTLSIAGALYSVAEGKIVLEKADPNLVTGAFTPIAGTTSIAREAFKDCKGLTFLYVPDTVTSIGWDALAGCSALEGIAFNSNSAPQLAASVFGNTTLNNRFTVFVHQSSASDFARRFGFKNVNIVAAGDSFFVSDNAQVLYCDYLNNDGGLSARSLLRVAGEFEGALAVNDATITINPKAASGCAGITSVNVPSSVASVGDEAFKNCSGIKIATMGQYTSAQIDRIGDSAFEGCTSLLGFRGTEASPTRSLPKTLTSIGKRAFAECDSITYISIQGTIDLPEEMVAGCDSLQYVTVSSSYIGKIKSIGARCFMNCPSITTMGASLVSFSGLESVGEEAYKGCTNLSLAAFPASLKSIGRDAFAGCGALDAIAFNSLSAPNLAGTGLETSWNRARIFVPAFAWETYKAQFSAAGLRVPEQSNACAANSYRAISGNMYSVGSAVGATSGDMKFLAATKTAISSGKGSIGAYSQGSLVTVDISPTALQGETTLKGFTVPASVKTIGAAAFKDCTSLATVDLGIKAETGELNTEELKIGEEAFANTPMLKELELRQFTAEIGSRAFAGVANGFMLDASAILPLEGSNTIDLGEKIFGDTLPANLQIVVSQEARTSFIEKWGTQLMREYSLTPEEMEAIFVLPSGSKSLSVASVDTVDQASDTIDDDQIVAEDHVDAEGSPLDDGDEAATLSEPSSSGDSDEAFDEGLSEPDNGFEADKGSVCFASRESIVALE